MDVIAGIFSRITNSFSYQIVQTAYLPTYIYNKVAQWRHDENGNIICKGCYDRHWRRRNPDYFKVWNLEHPDYSKVWHLEHPDYNKVWELEHVS